MSTANKNRYRIGYALTPKKVLSFIQPSLVSLAASNCIDIVPIDLSIPLVLQGPWDCIIHKIYGEDWKSQLEAFSSLNPNVPILDLPAHIEQLHNRISMLEVVQRIKIPENIGQRLEVPKQVVVSGQESPRSALRDGNLGFPLLAKPIVADGSVGSHRMYLIFDPEGLGRAKDASPMILQEFVNHGGVIFKVYVAGRHVRCVRRKSLRDLTEDELVNLQGAVSFSQISNLTAQKEEVAEGAGSKVDFDKVEIPPDTFVETVAEAMRKELRLHLFNFDLIRDAKDPNRYLVIDINYLPGFAKLPDYESILTQFFLDVLGANEQVDP